MVCIFVLQTAGIKPKSNNNTNRAVWARANHIEELQTQTRVFWPARVFILFDCHKSLSELQVSIPQEAQEKRSAAGFSDL